MVISICSAADHSGGQISTDWQNAINNWRNVLPADLECNLPGFVLVPLRHGNVIKVGTMERLGRMDMLSTAILLIDPARHSPAFAASRPLRVAGIRFGISGFRLSSVAGAVVIPVTTTTLRYVCKRHRLMALTCRQQIRSYLLG